jgi:cytochrome c peroxidase
MSPPRIGCNCYGHKHIFKQLSRVRTKARFHGEQFGARHAYMTPHRLRGRIVSWICTFAFASAVNARPPADIPLGLPPLPANPKVLNAKLISLGKELFFDTRMSVDGTISCGTCHVPERAFTDGRMQAVGVAGQVGVRNTPSLLNVVYSSTLFWDGRSTTLESQARLPLLNAREHGFPSEAALLNRIGADSHYHKAFIQLFRHANITTDGVAAALASYERTLLSGNSPFDRFLYGGDHSAMSDSAIRGLGIFRGRARCATCHTIGTASALLTDQDFHASPVGLPTATNHDLVELTQRVVDVQQRGNPNELNALVVADPAIASLGRFVVTRNPHDIGLFKTPSLRNVALTAPYLHDGSIATLDEVVDAELYSRANGVRSPIVLTAQQKADVIAFLNALSSSIGPEGQ